VIPCVTDIARLIATRTSDAHLTTPSTWLQVVSVHVEMGSLRKLDKIPYLTPGKRAIAVWTALSYEDFVFAISTLFDAPSRGTPCDINAIYTSPKSTLLTIRVYLHSFSCYCFRNTRNVAKFQENMISQQLKVIQGHRSWCQWNIHM